ncbi:hypothetical protein LOTGIDRAFT_152604 [Lottia gigantea]|uniref:Cytochrome b561 domain-containing protein n=1 Tax=Lottia gigantea TaxID=225164 RepID=V4A116_LOTGI|nr:hypothetical protein LOTGIDRAFT_152604 [Lottia gigantea]ESO97513.1 hypothetical protein LOTGIDRAFT_152604 [Lottia gigantea]
MENCGNCNDYDPSHPHSRCLHTGTMIDKDEFILFGGCLGGGGTGGPCPGGDSWRYGKSKTWKRLPDCAAPRMYGAMAMLPSSPSKKRVVMYGGRDTSKNVINTDGIQADQISVFDPDTDEWTIRKTSALSNNHPSKRQKSGMVAGPTGIYMFGGISSAAMNDLWILKGNANDVDNGEKVDCTSNFIDFLTIHGIFMVTGWGVLLQWGAFIARYMKFKDPLWFHLHRGFQVVGLVLSICGLAFAIVSVPFDHLKFPHAIIGIIVMILGILQPINAAIRPHKPSVGEEKSLRRKIWEFIHLNCGRTALVFALINISLGVLLSVTATHNLIIWFVYLAILVLAYIIAEVLKCVKKKNSGKTDSFNLENKT